MVHALKESWRVVRRGLLDIRPSAAVPVVFVRYASGREVMCGGLSWQSDLPYSHERADEAVQRAVALGLFEVADRKSFDWVDEFATVDELVEAVEEEWPSWHIDEQSSLTLVNQWQQAGREATAHVRQSIRAQWMRRLPAVLV